MKPSAVKAEFLLPRLQSISESGIFSNRGPQVVELESRLAKWLDVRESHLVVTSNATVALTVAAALSPSMSWDVPAWSFPATALAPLLIGKDVTFVDIDPDTWLVVDERSDSSTGLMNVIPFGGSLDQSAWAYPGELLIDAAASLATRPSGLKTLPGSAAVIFSLHATKTMGGAEGGVVVFGSEERAALARAWINFGFSGSRESIHIGTNGKMSEYDAAVANARLDGWPEESQEWETIRQLAVQASEEMNLQKTPDSMVSVNPYWIALFETSEQKKSAADALNTAGVETRLWWAEGLHKMPAFQSLPRQSLKVVDDFASRYLGLPFHLSLSTSQFSKVADVIR